MAEAYTMPTDEEIAARRAGVKTVTQVKTTEVDDVKNTTEDDNEEPAGTGSAHSALVEAQIINHLLSSKDLSMLNKYHLDESYFPGYSEELGFILDHYKRYQVVPDLPTFLDKFEDFDLFDVNESELAMAEKIKEAKGYSLINPLLDQANQLNAKSSVESARLLNEESARILREINILHGSVGYDIFKMAHERAEEYIKRVGLKGQLGCMMNIEKIDEATHGIMPEDFVALTARPGKGKSWIQEYIDLGPWLLQKRPILHFSLENPKFVVGWRADTLLRHFSNDALISGKEVLRWENGHPALNREDYLRYVDEAKHFDVPFIVIDNSDSPDGGWSVEDILELAEVHNPALISIDQLSLMMMRQRFKSIREGYIHITRTLRQFVTTKKTPVLLNCQSGREFAKVQAKDKEASPELHQIAESDSVGQDATKVLSLTHAEGILKVSLKKNTLGRDNVDALMKWDIDLGLVEPITLQTEDEAHPERLF
jgi:replicative DNA helicase